MNFNYEKNKFEIYIFILFFVFLVFEEHIMYRLIRFVILLVLIILYTRILRYMEKKYNSVYYTLEFFNIRNYKNEWEYKIADDLPWYFCNYKENGNWKEIKNRPSYHIYGELENKLHNSIWDLSQIIFIKLYKIENNNINKNLIKYNITKKDLVNFDIIYKISLLRIKLMLYYTWDTEYYISNEDITKINNEFIWDDENDSMNFGISKRLYHFGFIIEDKKENEFFDIYLNEEFYKKLFILVNILDIVLDKKEIKEKKIQEYFIRNKKVMSDLCCGYAYWCTEEMSNNLKESTSNIIEEYKEEWFLLKSNKIELKIFYNKILNEIDDLLNILLLNINKK